ncbi:MAG: HAD-IA family hydrolase [Rhodoferax sp.]|nr:HAD-IA family hydrolase [Rhodoferax sp.]
MTHDLICFDLDGTLVDTAAEIAEAVNLALEAHGIARRPVDEIVLLIGNGTADLMRRLRERLVQEQPALDALPLPALLASLDRFYAQTTGTQARPYPGCVEALTALRDAGVRMACVTNKELHHAQAVLRVTGLDGFFALTVGGDTLPEKKPHASVLRHVAGALGVPLARCAHVGDSLTDVLAARNAGVAAWAVPYGYNAGRPIADARPDRLFDGLGEVARHVLHGA